MPVTHRPGGVSSERTYQTLMDWTRKIMQLAGLALVILAAYLLYGLLFGGVGQWSSVTHADRMRIAGNVHAAILYLNIALGVFLVTATILFYDEEAYGYSLAAAALVLYYGIPFALDALGTGQMAEWQRAHNLAALDLYAEMRLAGAVLAVPAVILVLRDILLRLLHGTSREDFAALQYGGSTREEAPVGTAPIGLLAKCWQLPFCRDAIRKRCPIYIHRTRCWRERVGCMCEENVIRHALDAVIHREPVRAEEPARSAGTGIDGFVVDSSDIDDPRAADEAAANKTAEMPRPEAPPPPTPQHVRIPHNPNLSAWAKAERCRNCIIYNEHQRLKYQFLAPLVVLAVPALAYLKMNAIEGALSSLLGGIDRAMAHLSLDPNARNLGIASSLTSTSIFAQYLLIGCLVVIATTMALRALEYVVFKLKI